MNPWVRMPNSPTKKKRTLRFVFFVFGGELGIRSCFSQRMSFGISNFLCSKLRSSLKSTEVNCRFLNALVRIPNVKFALKKPDKSGFLSSWRRVRDSLLQCSKHTFCQVCAFRIASVSRLKTSHCDVFIPLGVALVRIPNVKFALKKPDRSGFL